MPLLQPLILRAEILRFGAVIALGLMLDIIVAWTLSEILLVNTMLASSAGFAVGAGSNYILHQAWTFQHARSPFSPQQMIRYCVILGATLATRLGSIYGLENILPEPSYKLAILIVAIASSFFVNYLGSKIFVFKRVWVPNSSEEDSYQ